MSMFSTLEVSGSALAAERQRAEVVAANMANAETTHTPAGGPYRRKEVVFSTTGNLPFRMMLAGFPLDAERRSSGRACTACGG